MDGVRITADCTPGLIIRVDEQNVRPLRPLIRSQGSDGEYAKGHFRHQQQTECVGYATAVAGKWQLAILKYDPDHPHRLGFDEYCLFGWHEGPRYYQPLLRQNGVVRDDVQDRYRPDVYCEFLIDFIERNRDRPFFAFYSMALCHDVTDDLDHFVPFAPGRDRYDNYREMAEAMDIRVGRMVTALERLGLRENTLILFTTDNGTSKSSITRVEKGKLLREPVYSKVDDEMVSGGKGNLTDSGTHVPLIASQPKTVPEGQVVDDLVDMSDILPTLAALGRAPLPEGVRLDGHSFADRLRNGDGRPRQWAFSEQRGRSWVRTQRWKLYQDGRFFDMFSDPQETNPLGSEATSQEAQNALNMLRHAFSSGLARVSATTVHDNLVLAMDKAELSLQFRGRTADDCHAWQRPFRGKLLELLGDSRPPAAWNPVELSRTEFDTYTRLELVLESTGVPSLPVYLLVPKTGPVAHPRPGVLCVHGHGPFGNDAVVGRRDHAGAGAHIDRLNYDYAVQFAERGYVVAAPCLIPRFDRHAVRTRDMRPDVSLGTDPSHWDISLRHRSYPQLIAACFPQRMAPTQ